MATPTGFHLPIPSATALADALEKVQRERDDATPELDCFGDIEHDYKYECEQQLNRLTHPKVDQLRSRITDTAYYRREVEFYCSTYAQMIFDKLERKHEPDGRLTLDGLRGMKTSCRRLLAANGLTGESLRKKRFDITDQSYWKPEAELLQELAAIRATHLQAKRARDLAKAKTKKPPRPPTRKSSRKRKQATT
ncbi:hypothetical protein K505DRAFT_134033 [Melanomma pulvis-pyrius CBS 109.77]|uniref:Uncharacterized protein n=1 Tax=Melanomma pulvis-pyrius CBS 109.77 TaxID=1314802 RepID=A0A6A6WSK3_9PLEO|nr:hypothetical protein K505DRAFT_134033 [Melanomma pulvis-pyrius CBS 109.77]